MILRAILLALALAAPALAWGGDMEKELMEADRRFCADVQEGGADAWALWFEEDGTQFPPRGRLDGREAILAYMEDAFLPGAPALLWEPTEAVVAAGGEIGWTLGRWRLESEGEVVGRGNYVTLWRKGPEGMWKVAVDIGNQDPKE